MRLSSEGGLFRRRLLSSSPWPAPIAMGAAGRRPLPGAGRSPARLAPPAVGAAPRFAQGSSRAPCGRPCAPLRGFAPSGRPFPCPAGAPLAAGRPRSLCLGRRPGFGWGALAPALRRAFCGALRPPRKKGFLSPLRRRHGDYLIVHYAAQHVANLCVAHTVIKMVKLCTPHHGHFKQNMIYFV